MSAEVMNHHLDPLPSDLPPTTSTSHLRPSLPLQNPPAVAPPQNGDDVLAGDSGAELKQELVMNVHMEDFKPEIVPDGPAYLQPAEFYPLNNHLAPLTSRTGANAGLAVNTVEPGQSLSPEDDKLATRGIPIFRPTLEEFEDFEGYVTKTVPWGQYSGIVKVIPPDGWKRTLPPIPSRALANVRIKSPIQQNMLGQAGLFRQTNVEKMKNRPLSIQEWFEKSQDRRFVGPGPKDLDPTLDRDSKAAKEKRAGEEVERKKNRDETRRKRLAATARRTERLAAAARAGVEAPQPEDGSEGEDQADETQHAEQTEPVDLPAVQQENEGDTIMVAGPPVDTVPPLDPSSRHSPQSSPDPLAKTPESNSEAVPEWYETFDFSQAWLPKDTRPEDYTPEACLNLERKFWKTMGLGEPSWYGADLQGTLFPDPETPWNVAHLPNLLNRLGRELPGVNRPYLYFGMWRAAFAWHVEDMDLFSINYIHFGAPKFWYAIPQGQAEQFERNIKGYFPQEAAECDQFLRHKSYIMSPTRLAKDGIHVNMLVHNQGEFVITYPRGYHAGFNLGFNCAESVNFALDSWVELGRRAKVCQCVSHSVRIDVDELLGDQAASAEHQDRVMTEQDLIQAFEDERNGKTPRKRMMMVNGGNESAKRRRRDPAVAGESDDMSESEKKPNIPIDGLAKKKKAISLEKKSRPPAIVKIPTAYPCIICPNLGENDLLPVFQPGDHVKALCKSRDRVVRAHESCVTSVPEVWVDDEEVDGVVTSVVMGMNLIEKSRWNLKCQSCSDKKVAAMGAKIQCVNGKCPKAFHVSCARDDEQVEFDVIEMDEWEPLPIPTDAPEGTQHEFVKRQVYQTNLLCPSHNPKVKEAKKAHQAKELKDKIMSIIPGQSVKIKTSGGSFEVKLVRVFEESQKADVEHQNGSTSVVKWTDFDFRPGPAQPLENEYARIHTHTRKRDSTGAIPNQSTPIGNKVNRQHLPVQLETHAAPIVNGHSGSLSTPQVPSQAPRTYSQLPQFAPAQQMPNYHNHGNHGNHGNYGHHGHQGPSPLASDPHHIPSRVVVCDSEYRNPLHDGRYYQQPLPHHQTSTYYSHTSPTTSPASTSTYGLQNHQSSPGYSSQSAYQPVLAHNPIAYATQPLAWGPPTMSNQQARQYGSYGPAGHFRSSGQSNARTSSTESTSSTLGQPHHTPHSNGASAPSVANGHSSAGTSTPTVSGGVGQINLGLDRMSKLMQSLPPFRVPAIHLAGTNGKGSVSAMLESCLRAGGLRVARYNSPHLIEPRDAISLDGVAPSAEDYAVAMQKVQRISEIYNLGASTFEIATAAAFDLINTYKPEVMIIECGMGGATDATNVIPPNLILASGLTAVGLDHTGFLGDTIAKITEVKARIAVKGGLLVVGRQPYGEVGPIAHAVAREQGATLIPAYRAFGRSTCKRVIDLEKFQNVPLTPISVLVGQAALDANLSLGGAHQVDNAALAATLLFTIRKDPRALSIQPKLSQLSDQVIMDGLARATWPGRCSFVSWMDSRGGRIPVLVDGAHNADSAKTLRSYVDNLQLIPVNPNNRGVTWVIGLSDSKGKSIESVLEPLLRPGDSVIATTFSNVEGMPWVRPVHLTAIQLAAEGLVGKGNVRVCQGGVEDALRMVEEAQRAKGRGLVVVCGSLYLVADVYRLLDKRG